MDSFLFLPGRRKMATTRLIALHINKGKTVAQCLAARTDYAQNEKKTNDGKYVSSYKCDPKTADEEFLLSKREYYHITGKQQKRDVIAYQIRQSFRPGEITPEDANQIGYETAMRFTKGNHAFVVATHTDRAHIHNHIIFNSTTLDCKKKFRDFFRSGLALRRVSDQVCIEHGLSVISLFGLKRTKKRLDYPKKESIREQFCDAIDQAMLEHPKNFEELYHLLDQKGFECRTGNQPAFRKKGVGRYLRFRSLPEGYRQNDLEQFFLRRVKWQIAGREKTDSTDSMQLLINIQDKIQQGKGIGYERWAKVFNLKQMAKVMCFLRENGIGTYAGLEKAAKESEEKTQQNLEQIRQCQNQIAAKYDLQKNVIDYLHTRNIYQTYKQSGYSKVFKEQHKEEILKHQAAKKKFNELEIRKLPKVKDLQVEIGNLQDSKNQAYESYKMERKRMKDLQIAKKNVDLLMGLDERETNSRCRKKDFNR